MKKITIIFSVIFIIAISVLSCRNEDVYNSVEQNKEYASKSLWQEDQVYIKNINKVYDNNANIEYIYKTYGTVAWEYAMSMGRFNESYLIVPVTKNHKVLYTLEVYRKGSKVFFYFSNKDNEAKNFFEAIIFNNPNKIKVNSNNAKVTSRSLSCRTITLIVGSYEGVGGEQYPIEKRETICKFVDEELVTPSDCLDPSGDCSSGGGSGGGYNYPNQNTDPCATAKIGVNNANTTLSDARIKTDFTDKMKNIAASSTNSETGMTIGKDSNGNIKVTEPIAVTGTAGQVPAAPAGYNAIADGHNHNYSNPPSPGDLWTMMENLVNNPYFETRYIFGQDGSIYALTVNDRQAAIDFLAAYPRSQYLKPNSGDFIQSGALFDDFDNAKERLMNYTPFMSQIDATKNAMAYIMDKYGMGISLSKSNGTKLEAVNAQQNPDGTYSTSTCN